MRVALFVTCVNDALYPATGRAVVTLLERLGVEVDFPFGQTCCGQPQFNTGYRAETVPLARRTAAAFAGYDHVVTPSGSCAAMIRDNYPRLGEFGDFPGRVYELTEFLVDVESEGNGRMCLTLPETLISVVGIEKVIPTWQDLEVFLQLLPRSSTAERMNPYTSIWTGTADGDGDGPSEFHLVLLDNGRTDTLADQVGRQALRCIRCSACLNVCPVYERAGGHAYGSPYPGPIGAILTPQLRGLTSEVDASLPYASTLCGACYEVCPVAIDIPEVLVHLRRQVAEDGTGHRAERAAVKAATWLLGHPAAYRTALRTAAATRRLHPRRLPLPGPAKAWSDTRDLPAMPEQSFRDWWKQNRAEGNTPR